MITTRPSAERGHFNHGWLDTHHTFSFGDYHDPKHMHFRALRVINEDTVGPGQGFGMHPHRDMEIITWVLDGELKHADSMGHGSVIRPGDVQHMSAGTGIMHSEFNPSKTDPVHLLQVWIMPDAHGHKPVYAQRHVPIADRQNRLALLVSSDGCENSLAMHQDASMLVADLDARRSVERALAPGRHAWVQVASGDVSVIGRELGPGDGLMMSNETTVTITARSDSQVLVFDLA